MGDGLGRSLSFSLKGCLRKTIWELRISLLQLSITQFTMAPSWNDLPEEIRIMILVRSNLVRHRDFEWDSRAKVGANILDGRLMAPRPESDDERQESDRAICEMPSNRGFLTRHKAFRKKLPFPFALFLVSHRMYWESMRVFFSHNRFVLKGDLKDSHRFLYDLPDWAISQIRVLDLELSFWQSFCGASKHGIPELRQWQRLIELIHQRLRLDRLWLSVDAGSSTKDVLPSGTGPSRDHSAMVPRSYAKLFEPLRQLKGLRKYHVFVGAEPEYEVVAEKEVMGPDYDSAAEGKLPYHLRSSCSPHLEIPKCLRDDVDQLLIVPS